MKTSLIWLAVVGLFLGFSATAFASGDDLMNQALDLVHQAWSPGGDAPTNDQRTDLLTQALKLTQDAPHAGDRFRGHRVKAIQDIRAALLELKDGDTHGKAVDYIRDADSELRISLSI